MTENSQLVAQSDNPAIHKAVALANDIQVLAGNQLQNEDAMLLGSMFQSGYFKDIDSLSKAVTRAVFGKRLGVDVALAISALYIIDGKPALEANAVRNQCVMAGFTINTKELSNDRCLQEWLYKDQVMGTVEYTKEDAIRIGFIDPTCTEWPVKHNERPVRKYNKWQKKWEEKNGCECKDNWRKVPQEMLQARCTTKGARMYGGRAFNNQAVYDIDEMQDSNLRVDTTPIDVALGRVNNATTTEELTAVIGDLTQDELIQCSEAIKVKTQELLQNEQRTSGTPKK